MITRALTPRVERVLKERPAVLLVGPRQAGKTTLAQSLVSDSWPANYVTFDRLEALTSARTDLEGFLAAQGRPLILDEVQHLPEVFLPLKLAIDEDRQPGSYLLTGSANVMLLPTVADSLVGRLSIQRLLPLSQAEIRRASANMVDKLFADDRIKAAKVSKKALIDSCISGGFPEIQSLSSEGSKSQWFADYLDTLIQRDLRDIAAIEAIGEIPRILAILAARSGGLLNLAALSRDTGVAYNTLKRYLALFDLTFLTFRLPAYRRNLGKRLMKSPKLFFLDSGVLCRLLNTSSHALTTGGDVFGRVLESFVISEFYKLATTSSTQPSLMHYRSNGQGEVDLVMESRGGDVVAVEVKATTTASSNDAKGLMELREGLGDKFKVGIVLHTGDRALDIADRVTALPISALWS